jgi:hypothetical protein
MSLLKTKLHSKDDPSRSHSVAAGLLLRSTRSIGLEPVSFGVPLERGTSWSPETVGHLHSPNGEISVAQLRPLSRWFDGSVQWLLVDAIMSELCEDQQSWTLSYREDSEAEHAAGFNEFRAIDEPLSPPGAAEFAADILERSRWQLFDKSLRECELRWEPPRTQAEGPVRTTIARHGKISRLPGIEVDVQWDFFSIASVARCKVTLRNSRRAQHRGGLWDLGDPGSHFFKEFSYRLSLPAGPSKCELIAERAAAPAAASRNVHLYQDSSGGTNWQSQTHVNREGRIPCQFCGYKLEVDGLEDAGLRASPALYVETGGKRIGVAVPGFWQQFPKSLVVSGNEIKIGLFPAEWGDLHELQGGEQKSHEFWVAVQPIEEPVAQLDWAFSPARIVPSVKSCQQDAELQGLQVGEGYASECFQQLMAEAIDGDRSIVAQRERVDEYGWRNYGDLFADHEQLHYHGGTPLVSHYNNQFDVLRGLLRQFVGTIDTRWFELADALARHVIDIDIYHTSADRAAYSGGMFWFTDHYLHAHTSTHRTYSRRNADAAAGGYGGGPGAEHNYTSGLKTYYFLTGNEAARHAVIGLADWVVRMEDGRRTVFGLLDDGPTGSATVGHAKPSRGGANSINALLDGWQLTHRAEYRDMAEQVICRCVHPDVDVAELDLLNLEKSWSYTMFYSSLAKYLVLKEEAGELDAMYVYARRSLLRAGEWMLNHERPYFDQLEKLEYPTEAWPAQEFRKSNVLRCAARYANEATADAMRGRADELGDRAWADLMRFDTRSVARALVLVMNEGMLDCALRTTTLSPPPKVDEQRFGMPARESFVSQRERVRDRLRSPVGMLHAASRVLKPKMWVRAYQLASRSRKP